MAQFDYYANADKGTNTTYPFIVDVQDALLDGLNSRVVIPLTPSSNLEKPYPKNLCPEKPEKTKPFYVRDLVLRHVGQLLPQVFCNVTLFQLF